jgi:hypothetical protein
MIEEYPHCYGVLENVFPVGENGLRSSPETCMVCVLKTECLRVAMMKHQGLRVQDELVDRAYDSGLMGFFHRWSKKKALHRQMKEKETETETEQKRKES